MKNDNAVTPDLESLRNAARAAREDQIQPRDSVRSQKVTHLVHVSFRILQSTAAGITLIFLIVQHGAAELPEKWNLGQLIIYTICFVVSLTLAVMRLASKMSHSKELLSMSFSGIGFFLMLYGAVMAMRHVQIHVDVDNLTDDEIAEHPFFLHNLTICALSILGSSVYLVHAWLCYDCWWWEKKERRLAATVNANEISSSDSVTDSTSSMETTTHQPSTSRSTTPGHPTTEKRHRESIFRRPRVLRKRKGQRESDNIERELVATLNEILRSPTDLTHVVSQN